MIGKIANRIRRISILTSINILFMAIIFLIIEGFSSTIFVARDVITSKPVAERRHTEYDEELGWVNMRNFYSKNMYGSGVYLKTNSQAVRYNEDFNINVPKDKIRIICSGDSFTFGYGVDNEHTWCQLLTSLNKRLEVVNMGQGGYGVDQAYLWYKRDGTKLEHNIHIFAFITEDFRRMGISSFLGYGKPLLEVKDGALIKRNVPVPKPSFYKGWIGRNMQAIEKLQSFRLLRRLFFGKNIRSNDDQSREVLSKILEDMHQTSFIKHNILVLLYLPIESDYVGNESGTWRQFLHAEATKHDIVFVDVIDEFRKLPPQAIERLFIREGVIDYVKAEGHYTKEGNEYVANIIYKKLISIREISNLLKER